MGGEAGALVFGSRPSRPCNSFSRIAQSIETCLENWRPCVLVDIASFPGPRRQLHGNEAMVDTIATVPSNGTILPIVPLYPWELSVVLSSHHLRCHNIATIMKEFKCMHIHCNYNDVDIGLAGSTYFI